MSHTISPPLGLGLSAECFENCNNDWGSDREGQRGTLMISNNDLRSSDTSRDPFGLGRYSFPVIKNHDIISDQENTSLPQDRVECEIPSPSSTFENPIVRPSGYQFRKVSAVLEASEARRFQRDQDSDRSSSQSGHFPMTTMRTYKPTRYQRSELMEAGIDEVASSSPDSLDNAEPTPWDPAEVNLAAFRFGGPSSPATARRHSHTPMRVSVAPDRENGSPLDWFNVTSPVVTPSSCSSSDYSFPSEEDVNNTTRIPIVGSEKPSGHAIKTDTNIDSSAIACPSQSADSSPPEIRVTAHDGERLRRSKSSRSLRNLVTRAEKDQVHEPRPKTLSLTYLHKKSFFRNILLRSKSHRINSAPKPSEDGVEELETTSSSQIPLKGSELKVPSCKEKDQAQGVFSQDDSSSDLRAPIYKTSKARLSVYGPVSNLMGSLAPHRSMDPDSKPPSRETSDTPDKPLRTRFHEPPQTKVAKEINNRRYSRAGIMRRSKSMDLKAPVQIDQNHQSSLASSQPASFESHPSQTNTPTKARSRLRFWRRPKDSSISSEVSTGTGSTRSEMGRISGPISIRLMTDNDVTALFGPSGEATPYQSLQRSERASDSSGTNSLVDELRSSQSPLTEPVRYNTPTPINLSARDNQTKEQQQSFATSQSTYPADRIGSIPRARRRPSSVQLASSYSTLAKPPRPPRLRPIMASGLN